MIRKTFPLEYNVYNRRIVFLYGSWKEINLWAKRNLPDNEPLLRPGTSGNWCTATAAGTQTDYISIVDDYPFIIRFGSLVHEVTHHAVYVFSTWIRSPIEEGHDEPFCYYVQQIVGQCLQVMGR